MSMTQGLAVTGSEGWRLHVIHNPYSHSVPDIEFVTILKELAEDAASSIAAGAETGEYPRNSMGFVLLDPTAPASRPSDETVMAFIAVGPEGHDFLVNGAAKVIEHCDLGDNCGVFVYTQMHRLADGSFRYGHSVILDGTPVGGSGLSEAQDRYLCTLVAAKFNLRISEARKRWEESMGKGRWFCDQDEPGERFAKVVEATPLSTAA